MDIDKDKQDIAKEDKKSSLHNKKNEVLGIKIKNNAFDYSVLPNSSIDIDVLLGDCLIEFHSFLNLSKGDVVALNKQAGEGVDIYANDRIIGVGGVQVVKNKLMVKIQNSVNIDNVISYLNDEQYINNKEI